MLNDGTRLHKSIVLVCPIDGVSVEANGEARIAFRPEATQQQRDEAAQVLATFDWSAAASDLWQAARLREQAKQFQDEQHAQNVAFRAFVKLVVDENNLLRQWITDFKAAVAAAGSLGALKTGVAGLPNVPQRTYAQAKSAINNLVDGD